MGSGVLHLMEETTVSQTTLKDQSRDNPLPQEPHIRGPVSSYGGLQSRGKLFWLLSMMVVLRHARSEYSSVWALASASYQQICQIAIFLVIRYVHPHKDFCFVFDSLQATFNWSLNFEALTVPPKYHSICLSWRNLCRPWTCQKYCPSSPLFRWCAFTQLHIEGPARYWCTFSI